MVFTCRTFCCFCCALLTVALARVKLSGFVTSNAQCTEGPNKLCSPFGPFEETLL
jgi:hypothetical protein